MTPLLLANEAERGDAFALEIILETARYLAVGIVTVVHAVDPEVVILGGAMNFGGHATRVGRDSCSRYAPNFSAGPITS